ncbi:hypothetical protein HORIV_37440 [Vreelandella olivaria]|uniref:Uncharacterized protein n=1 Tax=Vreelandella olivaria TaxID=390919 RepID=A0ABN5WWJ9_9GAMM|nr:hypothetical protein HORIV_37440 [Halomonas olivaria]
MNMEALTSLLGAINGVVWGPVMLILLLGVGIYLQLGLKLMPIRKLGMGFRLMWAGRDAKPGVGKAATAKEGDEGEISPFDALMTALSATIGTGNIAGVATAIALGESGAVFWMWITALVGMATKFSEAVLAVRYRETDSTGYHVGGPMFYIKNGLGKKWLWLGGLFSFLALSQPSASAIPSSPTPLLTPWTPPSACRTGSRVWSSWCWLVR